jgi:hypothetical protein
MTTTERSAYFRKKTETAFAQYGLSPPQNGTWRPVRFPAPLRSPVSPSFFGKTVYTLGMNRNTISFQSIVENGVIRLPAAYREVFTAPVVVTVREVPKEKPLPAGEITARLNEIYRDNPAVIDEDIQLAQYNLVGEGDW